LIQSIIDRVAQPLSRLFQRADRSRPRAEVRCYKCLITS